MISLICTNCKAELTIDDAFAGGVCRCQHCGTIQTVPAKSKAVQAPQASTALHGNGARRATQAGGLDDLAEAVSSSGLTGSGLSGTRRTAPGAVENEEGGDPRRKVPPMLLIGGGALVALLLLIIVVLLFHGHGSTGPGPTAEPGTAAVGDNFCGIPLAKNGGVIFLLDRGNSITDDFDTVKAVSFKAIEDLGPSRKFQVVLWNNDSGTAEFPAGHMEDATPPKIAELRQYFQDTIATGSSRLSEPLKSAIARAPQEIIIATGKGSSDLDDEDAATLRTLPGKGIRVDVIQVYTTSPSPNAVLEEVAKATGGQARSISSAELRAFPR